MKEEKNFKAFLLGFLNFSAASGCHFWSCDRVSLPKFPFFLQEQPFIKKGTKFQVKWTYI